MDKRQERLENVIEGLEMSYTYSSVEEGQTLVPQQLVRDALALLKAQEPRVMTLEEVQNAEIVWIEQVGELVAAIKVATSSKNGMMNFAYTYNGGVFYVNINSEHYGRISRCWTSRPTDKQREAIPWNTGRD